MLHTCLVCSSGCYIHKIGTVTHKVCPSQEHSATLVMSAMVVHILEHPMMVSQGDHVPKGHSVWPALLNLILVALEHTVKALAGRVTRIVSCVIRATTVLGSSLQPQKDHVMLGITAQKDPFYAIRQLLHLGISLQSGLQSLSRVYLVHTSHIRSKVAASHVNQDFIALQRT